MSAVSLQCVTDICNFAPRAAGTFFFIVGRTAFLTARSRYCAPCRTPCSAATTDAAVARTPEDTSLLHIRTNRHSAAVHHVLKHQYMPWTCCFADADMLNVQILMRKQRHVKESYTCQTRENISRACALTGATKVAALNQHTHLHIHGVALFMRGKQYNALMHVLTCLSSDTSSMASESSKLDSRSAAAVSGSSRSTVYITTSAARAARLRLCIVGDVLYILRQHLMCGRCEHEAVATWPSCAHQQRWDGSY